MTDSAVPPSGVTTPPTDALSNEFDVLRETLIDFAEWRGDSTEDAEWAAETYLRERSTPPARCDSTVESEFDGVVACRLPLDHDGDHDNGRGCTWRVITSPPAESCCDEGDRNPPAPESVCEREYGGRHYFSIDGSCQRCGVSSPSARTTGEATA